MAGDAITSLFPCARSAQLRAPGLICQSNAGCFTRYPSTNTVTANVSVGIGPNGVAVTTGGAFVYFANQISNMVSVISAASNTVVATVPVGTVRRKKKA
ncbi:MAG TPA: hypothetical protein VN380_08020 [Thermoanaerobaculia bacterium]|jgi:YVTN family beta-propeller protein|nr:hypothetical protein [Thermoanaerobaculia bacterium]